MSDREDFFGPGCTCRLATVHATDIDPPDVKVNRNCPHHGEVPREYEYEDRLERDL